MGHVLSELVENRVGVCPPLSPPDLSLLWVRLAWGSGRGGGKEQIAKGIKNIVTLRRGGREEGGTGEEEREAKERCIIYIYTHI